MANRLISACVTASLATGLLVVGAGPAIACSNGEGAGISDNEIFAQAETNCSGGTSTVGNHPEASGGEYFTDYKAEVVCFIRADVGNQSGGCPLSAPDRCRPGQTLYQQYGLHNGTWEKLAQFCAGGNAASGAPLQDTPNLVARAFQRIPLPALRAKTQPADKTLINFDTIFFVDAAPLHRALTLLGQRVDLEITPSTFRWVHGDGTTAVTQTPGAAYPAKDVVYRYQHAHVTVQHHVEIVWTARWSLNGGPYQDVDGAVTTVGPDTPLQIAEATPALSGYGH